MNHQDHVDLIKTAIGETKGVWADFGSGDGAFTLALADITNQEAEIYSIDLDVDRLSTQANEFKKRLSQTEIHFIEADFAEPLKLPKLDGIIMANSLHYIKDKIPFLTNLKTYLKKGGKLVIVEYNVDSGNYWVPYPFSFQSFHKLCHQTGFNTPKLVAKTPSQFLNEIYCALATKNL